MKALALTLLLVLLPLHAGACIEKHNPGNLVKTGSLWIGIGIHEEISLTFWMPMLMKAIIKMENGNQPYTDDQIYWAVMDGLEYVRNNP